jgi:riboflavin synthase
VFTGLIQSIGLIRSIANDLLQVSVQGKNSQNILSDLEIGDSVAVDGVCLTVAEILADGFVADVSPETLERSTLEQRSQVTNYVNLETSLRVGSKIGGHFVTGHVDGIGCLIESIATQRAWEMTFAAPSPLADRWYSDIARYIVGKGSIAVNGISLTVADCDADSSWFKVAVIPHTYTETNLCYLKIGDLVNLECDILGKYVDKLLHRNRSPQSEKVNDISLAFLAEHGYI